MCIESEGERKGNKEKRALGAGKGQSRRANVVSLGALGASTTCVVPDKAKIEQPCPPLHLPISPSPSVAQPWRKRD